MDRIDTLQSLFRLFSGEPLRERGLRTLESTLPRTLGVSWAALWLNEGEGPRRKDRKGAPSRLENVLAREIPRRPTSHPWIRSKEHKALLWPLWVQGRLAGFYGLGPRTDGKPLPAADLSWMGLLAERTSLYLAERHLWKLLEAEHRRSMASLWSSAMLHEIRNPLTALSTLVQLLPQKKGDARFLESFEKIVPREIARLHRITQDLLDFSKPPGEGRAVVCLGEILDHLAEFLGPHFRSKSVELIVHHDRNLFLKGNRQQIEILVLNLVQNAFQSVGEGGRVEVTARWSAGRKGNPRRQVRLEVKDSGKGISTGDLDRIQEPFFSTRPGGLGLGLSIIQRILDHHGGYMSVKNAPGGGACFSLTFPGADRN